MTLDPPTQKAEIIIDENRHFQTVNYSQLKKINFSKKFILSYFMAIRDQCMRTNNSNKFTHEPIENTLLYTLIVTILELIFPP